MQPGIGIAFLGVFMPSETPVLPASVSPSGRSACESRLNTWKRPESVCGEFAGRTTGSSVVVRVSLTDATPVAIWTSRLEKFRKSTPTHPLAILGSGA